MVFWFRRYRVDSVDVKYQYGMKVSEISIEVRKKMLKLSKIKKVNFGVKNG